MSQVRRTRIEDYLATIDHVCEEGGLDRASTGAIAAAVGVSKGTVSSVLKQLAEAALIELVPYQGANLTPAGQKRVRKVMRRYRLIELFLSKTLGIEWETIREEAWRLEPAASEQLIQHIDRFLARPEFDPHGDPIPREDGTLPK